MTEAKNKLIRMYDRWCERGCDLGESDLINRMYQIGQQAFPEFKDEPFNLGTLEHMVCEAEKEK